MGASDEKRQQRLGDVSDESRSLPPPDSTGLQPERDSGWNAEDGDEGEDDEGHDNTSEEEDRDGGVRVNDDIEDRSDNNSRDTGSGRETEIATRGNETPATNQSESTVEARDSAETPSPSPSWTHTKRE